MLERRWPIIWLISSSTRPSSFVCMLKAIFSHSFFSLFCFNFFGFTICGHLGLFWIINRHHSRISEIPLNWTWEYHRFIFGKQVETCEKSQFLCGSDEFKNFFFLFDLPLDFTNISDISSQNWFDFSKKKIRYAEILTLI